MDPNQLLNRFLGADANPGTQSTSGPMAAAKQRIGGMRPGTALAGGLAAGGVVGLLLGSKKARKKMGKVAGYGGAAALGALALKAYQNWQSGTSPESAPTATATDTRDVDARFLPESAPAAGGERFELWLIRAMIGAAKADGVVDSDEQARLFEQVERLGLDAEGKAFVFDALSTPPDLSEIAAAVSTQEQAAEIYLVSRLAIDIDHPAERAYMEALAHRLKLPADLVAHLDRQAEADG